VIYTDGWKYRVESSIAYKLQCAYDFTAPHDGGWFAITLDGWLLIFAGFAWDGATKFPDFDWIKTPSLIHDALHNAIALGVIPEHQNDLIDKELELAINGNIGKKWMLKFRGWYVRTATGTANEKKGQIKKPKELPRLPNEITLDEYRKMIDV